MSLSTVNILEPDKILFQILQMIFSWDKARITNMVQHAIQLRYNLKEWKKTREMVF